MLGDMASGVTQTVLLQLIGIFVMAISQRQGGAATVGTALHGLFQMWGELMSGLGRSRQALKGWMCCLHWFLAMERHCMDPGLGAFATLHSSLL